MSFKMSNVGYEESRRVVDEIISKQDIETISTTATSNAYIATTHLLCSENYTVTLPNAEPGTIKVMTLTEVGEASVTISYVNGWGNPSTINMAYEGELVIFYASSKGWHTRTFLD